MGSASAPGAGRVVVLAGSTVIAEYGETDLAMRNMAIMTLRRVGFPGWRVAEVFGLTPTYVARLKSAASRRGAAALVGQDGPGRPRSLGKDEQDLAWQWREQGESDLEIGRRLGVAGTTAARQEELELAGPAAEPGPRADSSQEIAGAGARGRGAWVPGLAGGRGTGRMAVHRHRRRDRAGR